MIRQTDVLDRILDKELCLQPTRYPKEKEGGIYIKEISRCIYLSGDGKCEIPRCVRKVDKNG